MRKQQNEFVSVIKKEQPKLLRYVRQRLTGISDMDAEDIVADVLFNVYNRMTADNHMENLAAYLYQSVKHKIWDHFRQAKTPLSLDALDKDTGLPRGEKLMDTTGDVESLVEKKEFALRLKNALIKLEPKQRAVWAATELDGYTFKELSLKWGEPIGTLLSRTTQALRKTLQEE
ncbi:RNA polymerase sigma factor [Sporomusa termitida]|uniref:Sigma70-ECF: RNA polymerase sigma factor, sigma-70 family n=1 Tax=Sporomusa termitida TaxID=2377 RepID=A0A517DVC7_9FIRM|nr:sigma-70 family RNA polymerase sigma factor [Sporomusa termitida]QDR81293.1 sigma70-ECF: RNA polymerase sigma factor, sigma-70 family [Sporomusa termitida]